MSLAVEEGWRRLESSKDETGALEQSIFEPLEPSWNILHSPNSAVPIG
jgi:hypothetical protein